MSRDGGGPGGCLVTVLLFMVIGAAFGFIEWSTVGSFTRFIVYILVAGLVLIGGFMLWGYLSNKDK